MDDNKTGAGQPDPVAEARKMLDGVTPGPWAPDGEDQGSAWGMAWSVSRAENILDCVADAVDAEETARFIAWTREGVPALLDTIEALQAEVARMREALTCIADRCDEFHVMSISSIGRDPAKYGSGYSMVRDNIRAALKGGA